MKDAPPAKELSPEMLYQRIDPKLLPFDTTEECKSCEGIIGQERALKSIQTGLDIKSSGFNIFITGMLGTGRTTTIKKFLDKIEKTGIKPDDILYVNNFKSPDEPALITLPAGTGKSFQEDMKQLIEILQINIPELLKSPYYMEKRDSRDQGKQILQGKPESAAQKIRRPDGEARAGLQIHERNRRKDAGAPQELGQKIHHAYHKTSHRRPQEQVPVRENRRLPCSR
jgi:hypothetical protein